MNLLLQYHHNWLPGKWILHKKSLLLLLHNNISKMHTQLLLLYHYLLPLNLLPAELPELSLQYSVHKKNPQILVPTRIQCVHRYFYQILHSPTDLFRTLLLFLHQRAVLRQNIRSLPYFPEMLRHLQVLLFFQNMHSYHRLNILPYHQYRIFHYLPIHILKRIH